MLYLDFVQDVTDHFLEQIGDTNCAIAGNNGPYQEEDLPVRNTAHWLVTLSILYKITKKEQYLSKAKQFAEYLCHENAYGKHGIIKIRNTKISDYTDGIIGIAWIIEALMEAAKVLHKDEYYYRAVELFKAEFFDENMGLWKIVDIDDNIISIDYVYNHQLWFAASGAMILDYKFDSDIDRQITLFLNSWRKQLIIQPSGLLYHQVNYQYSLKSILKKKLKAIMCDFGIGKTLKKQKVLERGYQMFDLYGFALLYKRYSDCDIYNSSQFNRAMKFCLNKNNLKQLFISEKKYNKYAFPYNSPAFEYPYLAKTILGKVDERLLKKLMEIQINLCYSSEEKDFSRNNDDPFTLTARIYELVRYYDI